MIRVPSLLGCCRLSLRREEIPGGRKTPSWDLFSGSSASDESLRWVFEVMVELQLLEFLFSINVEEKEDIVKGRFV